MVGRESSKGAIDGMDTLPVIPLPYSRVSTSWDFIVTCAEGWTGGRKSLYKHPISTARRYIDVVEAKPLPLRDRREEAPMRLRTALCSAVSTLSVLALLSACSSGSTSASAGDAPLVGVDYPRSDTDFWNSYIK